MFSMSITITMMDTLIIATWQNWRKVNLPVASSSTSPAYPSMSSFLHSTPIDFRIIWGHFLQRLLWPFLGNFNLHWFFQTECKAKTFLKNVLGEDKFIVNVIYTLPINCICCNCIQMESSQITPSLGTVPQLSGRASAAKSHNNKIIKIRR